jgi:MtN3 and saliva related transmembrane protein
MTSTDIIGYAAAFLTTTSFLPQAWQTLRTRDVSGLSFGMYAGFTAGEVLWLAYGLAIRDVPLIVANAVTLALSASILAVKCRAGRHGH